MLNIFIITIRIKYILIITVMLQKIFSLKKINKQNKFCKKLLKNVRDVFNKLFLQIN